MTTRIQGPEYDYNNTGTWIWLQEYRDLNMTTIIQGPEYDYKNTGTWIWLQEYRDLNMTTRIQGPEYDYTNTGTCQTPTRFNMIGSRYNSSTTPYFNKVKLLILTKYMSHISINTLNILSSSVE